MTELNTANTAPALQAVKTPAWMSCATLDELNAYLKKIKTGGAKADAIRAKWADRTLHGDTGASQVMADEVDGGDPTEAEQDEANETLVLGGDMVEIPLKDGKAVEPEKGAEPAEPSEQFKATIAANRARVKLDPAKEVVEAIRNAAPGLTTRYLDPRLIDVREGWNARVDFGDIEELARGIKAQKALDGHGVVNDIRVKEMPDGRYQLVDGERRYHSIMHLIEQGEEFEFGVPCKVEPADATDKDLLIKMFTTNLGKPLLPYEEGMYFKRLQDGGMTIKQIEEATGRSDSSIWYGLALVVADDDLVDAINKGTIGVTIAKTIAVNARGDKAKQKELVAKAKDAKKSGDKKKLAALKKEIDEARRAKAAKERPALKIKPKKADDADIAQLGASVAARLKEVMDAFGMEHDTDIAEWIANDRELQIAANFGALQALKSIMGVKVKVEF